MDNRRPTSNIARLSFLSALAFYAFAQGVLANVSPVWLRAVVQFLASFGIYEIVFDTLFLLYNKYFYKMFDRSLNFEGDWNQIFIVSEYEDPLQGIRYGPVKISASPERISLSGENYRLDGSFSSSWQSELATIYGEKMVLLYVSEGTRRQNSISRGIMVFHVSGVPPSRLVGSFTDAAPATHSGPMHIFRDKAEYEDRLQELKARAGGLGHSAPATEEHQI